MLTLPAIVEQILGQAALRPRRVALQEVSGQRITYDQLAQDVNAVTAGLLDHGLRPGEVVLFTIPPSIASITLILALVRVGATIVAADPRMGAAVFASRIALARPKWVMAQSRVYTVSSHPVARALGRRLGIELPQLAKIRAQHLRVGPRLPGVPTSISLDELRRHNQASAPTHERASEVRIVIFTSGTTGSPKAVVHDERSIGASMQMILEHLKLMPEDTVFSNELYLNVPALMVGARSVLSGFGRFDPRAWMRDVHSVGATVASGVPSELVRVAETAQRAGQVLPASLRLLLIGSAPAHRAFLERLQSVLSPTTTAWSIYAMTEMLPVCAVRVKDKLRAGASGTHYDLVGATFHGVQLRVSEDGEVLVSGPNLFRGYLGGGEVSEHATGDLGVLDEQGRLAIVGRKKDMIIRGRDNIYPSLVESVVDSIAGVRRSCLCGYYDERLADERLVLVLEPIDGEDHPSLVRRVRSAIGTGATRIDANARPDQILVMPLPLDPRSHKIDRAALVARVLQASA